MFDPFLSPKLKLKRASKHIAELESIIREKFEIPGFQISMEGPAPNYVVAGTILGTLPIEEIQVVAADIVSNLRSALDQATSASVRTLKGGLAKDTYFCFASTADLLEKCIGKNMRRVDPLVLDFIKSVDPTESGNPHLWALNVLCNLDKHNWTVAPTIFCFATLDDGTIVQGTYLPETMRFKIISTLRPVSTRFFISYKEVEVILGVPLPTLLSDLAGVCERIIMGIEEKTRSIDG